VFTRDLSGFHKADAAHYDALLHGCITTAQYMDELIAPQLDRKMSEISPIEHAVMWIGVYEFQHCQDVPWRVVINECIELAKEFGGTDGHKYVNGVLNGLAPQLRATEVAAAKAAARAYAEINGCPFVEDGALRTIAEGAGTIALEITEQLSRQGNSLDAIVVPLGNGALLTGIGTWIRARAPGCKVIGVVASKAPAMKHSWETDRLVSTETADTAADGIAVRECVPYALDCMKATVDEVWEVSEKAIRRARDFSLTHYGLVVEEAGVAGLAGLIESGSSLKGKTVATIFCGGNVRVAAP